MITVVVSSKSDFKPLYNQRVAVSYDSFLNGYVSPYVNTDRDGTARIDIEHRQNAKGKVHVNGRVVHEGYIESFMSVSIPYP